MKNLKSLMLFAMSGITNNIYYGNKSIDNMKNIFTLALLLVAVLAVSCSGMRKFDRVETTAVERYSIVYRDNKCGLYDIQADSLVTAIKYDALRFGRTASEGGYEFTIWVSETDDYKGMISIESTTNEPMEIMFPKQK